VLLHITRTIYRGTERISSNALLNLLEVGPDPPNPERLKRLEASGRRLRSCGGVPGAEASQVDNRRRTIMVRKEIDRASESATKPHARLCCQAAAFGN
jgi:hypothetical protein